jgi:N utilization substance protein B
MLYQVDMNPDINDLTIKKMIEEQLNDDALNRFCWQIFSGVRLYMKEIDEQISGAAQNWKISRMAPTDRNAIRIGTFELVYTDTPPKVVIDEAVELSRTFGTQNSPSFVNGVLDKLIPPEKRTPAKNKSE